MQKRSGFNRSVLFLFLLTTYVCRLWPLHSLSLFERYLVTFPKVVESYVLEFAGMKEEVLGLAFPANKAVAFVHKARNCSFLHFLKKTKSSNVKCVTEGKTRPRFLAVAYLIIKSITYRKFAVNISWYCASTVAFPIQPIRFTHRHTQVFFRIAIVL